VEMVLTRYRPLLDEIAKRLLEKEVVEEAELREIVGTVSTAEVVQMAASIGGNSIPSGYGVLPSPSPVGTLDGGSANNGGSHTTGSVALATSDDGAGEAPR
jgi:hypothetical protein